MAQRSAGADLKFRAFSDRTRLRILHLLVGGEMCVCDIVEIINVPQPTASRHLAYLRKAGLVVTEKRGLWTYYSLFPPKNGFHKRLIECLASCFEEVAEIRRDSVLRTKLSKANRAC